MGDLKVGDRVRALLPDSLGIWLGIGEVKSVKQIYEIHGQCVTKQNFFTCDVLFNNQEIVGLKFYELEKVVDNG